MVSEKSFGPRMNRTVLAFALVLMAVALASCGQEDSLYPDPGYVIDLENEVVELKKENHDLEVSLHDAEAPDRSAADMARLDESEWRMGALAARQIIQSEGYIPANFDLLVDAVGLSDGIYWSPIERNQFERLIRARFRGP